jgi:hypothetical protein
MLHWKTEHETNTHEFIVERSTDGRSYLPVGKVAAANSNGIQTYQYTDKNIKHLNTEIVYYRLQQKDIDARVTFSQIVALTLNRGQFVLFYPNPVINEARLSVSIAEAGKVQANVFDSKGSLVKQQYWSLSAGSSSLSMNLETLAKGNYFLELKGVGLHFRKHFIK